MTRAILLPGGVMPAELGTARCSPRTSRVLAERHHFDPPHRIDPECTAIVLRALRERASG